MAFDYLSERFSNVIRKMRGQAYLTEANMAEMLREIRVILLEADVNFKVVKNFVNDVKEKALGQEIYKSVNAGQMIIKIVHDEMQSLLGEETEPLKLNAPTNNIMMVGLQGTGKTTTAAKLAYMLQKQKKKVLLVGLDVYRPAAIEQLKTLASQVGCGFYSNGNKKPLEIAKEAIEETKKGFYDVTIYDTAGRLQIDEELMNELSELSKLLKPQETLLLVDGSAGQDAVNVANTFHERLRLSGCVMSKLDGDAKGGAALSLKYLTGIPIKFQGTGEKITDLEIFHPDRMTDRILGMGDVVSLVEKAKEAISEKEAEKTANKLMSGSFTLDDFLEQMKMIKKLGSIGSIMKMVPGAPKISEEQQKSIEQQTKDIETIINSMTPYERKHPEVLKYSHKNRIARGSGKTNADINRVLKRFEQLKESMKMLKNNKGGMKMPPNFPRF